MGLNTKLYLSSVLITLFTIRITHTSQSGGILNKAVNQLYVVAKPNEPLSN